MGIINLLLAWKTLRKLKLLMASIMCSCFYDMKIVRTFIAALTLTHLSLSLLFFHITQTMSEFRIQIWGCPTTWVYIRCFWLVSFCSYWERVREKGVKCEPFMWETEFLTLLSHPSQSIFTLISTVYKTHRTRRKKISELAKNYDYFYLHANNTTSWIKIYLSTWPYIK